MKNTFLKSIVRMIRSTRSRFIALTAIVAIGVAFFTGVYSTSQIMGVSVDRYDDECGLKDITVYSNYGFSKEDVDAIKNMDEISDAEGSRFADVIAKNEDESYVTRIHSFNEDDAINRFVLTEGRMPEKDDEVLAEAGTMLTRHFEVGVKLYLSRPDNDLSDFLSTDTVTVVGFVDTPVYLNMTKENSTLSNQPIKTFLYIPDSAFTLERYNELNALCTNAEGMDAFSSEYETYTGSVKEEVEEIAKKRENLYPEELRQEALEKYNDGLREYRENEEKFNTEIADAEEKIADGKVQIADGRSQIYIQRADLDNALTTLSSTIAANRKTLDNAQPKLDEGYVQFNEKKDSVDALIAERERLKGTDDSAYAAVVQQIIGMADSENAQKLQDTLAQKEELQKNYASLQQYLLAANGLLAVQGAEAVPLDMLYILGNDGCTLLAASDLTSADTLTASLQGNPTGSAILGYLAMAPDPEAAMNVLRFYAQTGPVILALTGDTTFDTFGSLQAALPAMIEARQSDANACLEGIHRIDEGCESAYDAILSGATKALEEAEKELQASATQIEQGYRDLNSSEQENLAKIHDGYAQLNNAESELNEKEIELRDAEIELEDSRKEGLEKLVDAKQELADAKVKIDDIKDGEWTVLDRSQHYASVTYKATIEQMAAIGRIFPLFFLMVAVLVCLTTMARTVDEQRGETGVLRALGYSRFACVSRYLIYAISATVLGDVIGAILGINTFPTIIYRTWRMMYILPPMVLKVPWGLLFATSFAFVVVMAFSAWYACRDELKEAAAQLMRPKAPRVGKKILLERVPFIWKRVSFTWKVTIRNIVRDRKRFVMTVAGVAGCTALLVTGFGIRDSIVGMMSLQFDEITMYDGAVMIDDDLSTSEAKALTEKIKNLEDVEMALPAYRFYSDAYGTEDSHESIYIEVYNTPEDLKECFNLRTRVDHTPIELTDEGCVISEKLSDRLHLKVGDSMDFKDEEGTLHSVKITAITEMYIQHYCFMTLPCYEKAAGEKPVARTVLVQTKTEDTLPVQKEILEMDGVSGIEFYDVVIERFDKMVQSLDIIIWTIILSSMSLAFVVLGNLINVNISERQREIATLKVLGFRKKEVESYIFKENNILTAIGALAGIPIGILLHHTIMRTIEMEYVMFGRTVYIQSILASIALTILFGLIMDFFMKRKLHRIAMVESLKSVE